MQLSGQLKPVTQPNKIPQGAKTAGFVTKKPSIGQKMSAFDVQMQANLQKERRYYEEMVGIADDRTLVDIDELKKQIWRAEGQLKNFKNFAKSKSLANAKKII